MPRLKVLHIITRLDKGGSATGTLWAVARLDKSRYDTFLISGRTHDPDGEVAGFLKKYGIAYCFIDELQRELSLGWDIKAFFKLYFFIRKGKFDLVHTHSSKAGILGRWAAWLNGIRYIVHTPHGHIFYGYFGRGKTLFFIWIERLTALVTDKIITLTDLGIEEHMSFAIAPRRKFVTIPSGIDMDFFQQACDVSNKKKELQIPPNLKIIGTVARLDPIKGMAYLIDAMHEVLQCFPQTVALLVGDGSERDALMDKARTMGIADKVIFLGFRKDVVQLLSIMDIFVLPSLNEGMGRVILEAMACRKPVIATRVGGVPELINDGGNGILVPPQNAKLLAEAIMGLLCDPQKAERIAINGYRSAGDKYSLSTMVQQIDELYQELLTYKCKGKV
jgi:glycosyltransferase involved in cell wall biosynthesis